ncbi:MAG TPA: hypothetical protein PLH70_01180 [Bacteroidales bacterium]|nr:hypothetical protein [Bacteroidales bacterium]HOH21805.1 hypothetical protein [Bacteroidales bacterium]HPZ02701.1 hypothetical protein [Bacteroidales bacterium]HQB74399.1 hypothetical protein [Bacteroidales bacterium]
MKKLTVFLLTIVAVAVVSISFTSCEEQAGVYKPEKKISTVYEQEPGEDEYIEQMFWKWNGDKVTSVSYYIRGEYRGKDEFIYDGKKVAKIVDNLGYYAEFVYDGKKFEKIKCYEPTGDLFAEVIFKYDGKKVSVITISPYDMDKSAISMFERGFMSKLLPKERMNVVAKKLANPAKESLVFNLSYEGENLSSITEGSDVTIYSDYDTHSNVLYRFFPFSTFHDDIDCQVFSKNNPGKITVKDHGETHYTITHIYTYDGDFPVTIQSHVDYLGESSQSTTHIKYE